MSNTSCGSPVALTSAALALALLCVPARPQERPPEAESEVVEVGSRVRVTLQGAGEPLVGWIDARNGDVFQVVRASDRHVLPVPADAIRRLEVSRVRRSSLQQAEPGIVAGSLLGLVLGVGLTEEHSCDPNSFLCFDFGSEKLLGGLAGASIGFVAGGLLSKAIVPAESWTEVAPAEFAFTVGPSGASVALVVPIPRR